MLSTTASASVASRDWNSLGMCSLVMDYHRAFRKWIMRSISNCQPHRLKCDFVKNDKVLQTKPLRNSNTEAILEPGLLQ